MVERNAEVVPEKRIEWPRQALRAAREPLAPSGGREEERKEERGSPRGLLWPATAASSRVRGFGREANFLATQVEVRANRMNEDRPSFGRWNRV
jgi:hypothetical protein